MRGSATTQGEPEAEQGLGDYLLHRTGHGFGLGNHEAPWVAEGSTDILTENMLISFEPGIYVPGLERTASNCHDKSKKD